MECEHEGLNFVLLNSPLVSYVVKFRIRYSCWVIASCKGAVVCTFNRVRGLTINTELVRPSLY